MKKLGLLGLLLSILFFAGNASAQSMSVSPTTVLNVGETVTISYENTALAGQTVTIEMATGYPVLTTQTIKITLGSDGKGSGTWKVPSWISVSFNGPNVREISRAIHQP